jgi:hypothetical protein
VIELLNKDLIKLKESKEAMEKEAGQLKGSEEQLQSKINEMGKR